MNEISVCRRTAHLEVLRGGCASPVNPRLIRPGDVVNIFNVELSRWALFEGRAIAIRPVEDVPGLWYVTFIGDTLSRLYRRAVSFQVTGSAGQRRCFRRCICTDACSSIPHWASIFRSAANVIPFQAEQDDGC